MVEATVLKAAALMSAGADGHAPKPGSTTLGQTAVSVPVWKAEGLQAGIWEVTPGTFSSTRDGYHEICQILSGRATITEANGRTFDVEQGTLFVTPAGWVGTWTVHETLRKVWVVQDLLFIDQEGVP